MMKKMETQNYKSSGLSLKHQNTVGANNSSASNNNGAAEFDKQSDLPTSPSNMKKFKTYRMSQYQQNNSIFSSSKHSLANIKNEYEEQNDK